MQLITQITATDGNIKTNKAVDFNFTPVQPTTTGTSFSDGTILKCNIPNVFHSNPEQFIVKGTRAHTMRVMIFDSSTNGWIEKPTNWYTDINGTEGIRVLITHPDDTTDSCDIYIALDDVQFNLIPGLVDKSSIVTYVASDVNANTINSYRRWRYSSSVEEEVILASLFFRADSDDIFFLTVYKPDSSSSTVRLSVRMFGQQMANAYGGDVLATISTTLNDGGLPDSPTIDVRLTQLEQEVKDLSNTLTTDLAVVNQSLASISKSISQVSGIFVSR